MKRPLIITALTFLLLITAGLFMRYSYSDYEVRYKEVEAGNCKDEEGLSCCKKSWKNQMDIMYQDWISHLENILDQPKPTSELVPEAFGTLRTYDCWLQYLCHTVRMNGQLGPDYAKQITRDFYQPSVFYAFMEDITLLPQVPGCSPITEIEIPGVKLGYMPYCTAPPGEKEIDAFSSRLYLECLGGYQRQFSIMPGESEESINRSVALIELEQRLKESAYTKKSSIIISKLNGILEQMGSLEGNINTLHDLIKKLDDLVPCFPNQCD